MKLCELLLTAKDSVFSRMVITIKDPTIEIAKVDIQKIIQIPLKDCPEENQAKNNKSAAKKAAAIRAIIDVTKESIQSNHLGILNIADKSEELKTQQEIY